MKLKWLYLRVIVIQKRVAVLKWISSWAMDRGIKLARLATQLLLDNVDDEETRQSAQELAELLDD